MLLLWCTTFGTSYAALLTTLPQKGIRTGSSYVVAMKYTIWNIMCCCYDVQPLEHHMLPLRSITYGTYVTVMIYNIRNILCCCYDVYHLERTSYVATNRYKNIICCLVNNTHQYLSELIGGTSWYCLHLLCRKHHIGRWCLPFGRGCGGSLCLWGCFCVWNKDVILKSCCAISILKDIM